MFLLDIEFLVGSLNILTPVLSDEKSAVNLIEYIFYIIGYFFLTPFKILTFSLAFDF